MKYKKKPIVIEAMQWNDFNLDEVLRFLGVNGTLKSRDTILIDTLEGIMKASVGDYIIKGVDGEFYPCKPDIFEKTYEKVEE